MTSNHSFDNVTPVSPPEYFVGLDLGQAHDPTAIVVLERSVVRLERSRVTYNWTSASRFSFRHIERLPLGLDYPTMVGHVSELVGRPELGGRTTLIPDATGVGRPVVDMLRRACLPCRLMPVTITGGGRETCENGHWRVPKRDLITGLLLLFQRGDLHICGHLPETKTLMHELSNMRIKISLDGHDTYGAWREGEHDDLVLAAALACWRASRALPFLNATILKWMLNPSTSKSASSRATKTCAEASPFQPWSTQARAWGQPCAMKSTSAACTAAPWSKYKRLQNEPENPSVAHA